MNTDHLTRRQLTLFVDRNSEVIEEIRKKYNPLQYDLIPAHVTLCREDEMVRTQQVWRNVKSLGLAEPLRIRCGVIERFQQGRGVLIPAETSQILDDYRSKILEGIVDSPRGIKPHITLMHPRNSICTDAIFNQLLKYALPKELSFDKVSLIEQRNGGRWRIVDEFHMVTS